MNPSTRRARSLLMILLAGVLVSLAAAAAVVGTAALTGSWAGSLVAAVVVVILPACAPAVRAIVHGEKSERPVALRGLCVSLAALMFASPPSTCRCLRIGSVRRRSPGSAEPG